MPEGNKSKFYKNVVNLKFKYLTYYFFVQSSHFYHGYVVCLMT